MHNLHEKMQNNAWTYHFVIMMHNYVEGRREGVENCIILKQSRLGIFVEQRSQSGMILEERAWGLFRKNIFDVVSEVINQKVGTCVSHLLKRRFVNKGSTTHGRNFGRALFVFLTFQNSLDAMWSPYFQQLFINQKFVLPSLETNSTHDLD